MPPTKEWLNALCKKTNREWVTLKNQMKQGWCLYFKTQDRVTEIGNILHKKLEIIKKLKEEIKENDNENNYIVKQFIEIYDEIKSKVECPYCYDILEKDTIHIPKCGHLCCKECYEKIRQNTCKCGVCNKNFPKPQLPPPSVWMGDSD